MPLPLHALLLYPLKRQDGSLKVSGDLGLLHLLRALCKITEFCERRVRLANVNL